MKKVLFKCCLFLGLLLVYSIPCNSAFAQEPFFRNYTVEDGLPSMTVYRGLQGLDGRIWLATENGLSVFDGFEFKNWHLDSGLPDSEVIELSEDKDGRIWFSCPNGHIGFLSEDSIFSSANTDWMPQLRDVPCLMGPMEDGRMAVGDPTTILLLSSSKVDTFYHGQRQASRFVLELGEEGLWLLGADGTLLCFSQEDSLKAPFALVKGLPEKWDLFRSPGKLRSIDARDMQLLQRDSATISQATSEVLPEAPLLNHFWFGPEQELWLGSFASGAWKVSAGGTFDKSILKRTSVGCIFFDQSGNQWVTSMGKGLFFFPKAAAAARNFQEHQGLHSPEAHCLEITPDNKLLVGHGDLKLSVPGSPKPLKFPRFRSLGRARIRDLAYLDSGHLLVATDQNMLVLPPGLTESGETLNFSEKMWLTDPGIPAGESTRLTPTQPFVLPKQVAMKKIAVMGPNHWVGATAGGLIDFILEGQTVHFKYLSRTRCWAVAAHPSGEFGWVSGKETLYTFKNDSLSPHPLSEELHSRVLALVSDEEGGLWVATSGQGLFRVKGQTWQSYGRAEGLPSLNCTSLALESTRELWLGTDRGLVHLELNEQGSVMKAQTVGHAQGLLNSFVNDVALMGGEVWAATAEGVSAFDKLKLQQTATPPCLEVSKVKVQGRDTLVLDRYQLPSDRNSLTFHLWDPCFVANRFQYRIPENDSLWLDVGENIVDFPYLGEGGKYHLQFRSLNPQGMASELRSVVVKVAMPFYRSSSFLLGICMLSFGGLFTYLHFRNRHAAKERNEQQAYFQQLSQLRFSALKSQMNPHFLFNSLHSIQELVRAKDGEATHVYISRFATLMRKILDHSLEDFVSIAEEMRVTQLYLGLEMLRQQRQIEVEIVVDEKLAMEHLWMPALVLQPFVENAIWHGLLPKDGDRSLLVQVKGLKEKVLFTIEDNGIGRAAAASRQSRHPDSPSRSTQNFSERMRILNRAYGNWAFSYQYHDLKDEKGNPAGTRLEIRVPYLDHPPQPYRVG